MDLASDVEIKELMERCVVAGSRSVEHQFIFDARIDYFTFRHGFWLEGIYLEGVEYYRGWIRNPLQELGQYYGD